MFGKTFLISKPKLLPLKRNKDKSFYVTGDNLATVKPTQIKRKPLKLPPIPPIDPCDCNLMHLSKIVIRYAPKSRKRGASTIVLSMTTLGSTCQRKRMKTIQMSKKIVRKTQHYNSDEFFKRLEAQLKALNLGKGGKNKAKTEPPVVTQRSKEKEHNEGSETALDVDDGGGGDSRRRGKRRRKGRQGSDRLTSAGLAAQTQQDPETQVAGIGTDSQNNSSRGSVAAKNDIDSIIFPLPAIKTGSGRKTDSFLDDDMLKFLHREVDEEAIETEFNTKRRYVLEEAFRTRPERPYGVEMQALLRDLKVPAISLGDWLHIPRIFSRQNAVFSLPIDTNELENLTPMIYAARYVTIKKSKQLLYLTVLRKIQPEGYKMPIESLSEGLLLMMGGALTQEMVVQFKLTMDWENYKEEETLFDDAKLTLPQDHKRLKAKQDRDIAEIGVSIKYRTWCGVCAICERMYGRFPPRSKDLPDGFELSDFSLLETKLPSLNVHSGLVEILNTIRVR